MTDYETAAVETEYGTKIAIEGAEKAAIKGTAWGVTHYEPCYPDDEPDELDGFAWAVDINEESFRRVERALNTVLPGEFKTWERAGGESVELERRPAQNSFKINDSRNAVDVLDRAFSYENPDAQWDESIPEVEHVVDSYNRTAPLGLVENAENVLEGEGFDVTVTGPESGAEGADVSDDLSWDFPHDLRPYQNEAVYEIVGNDAGVVELPTGTGKTVTALNAIHAVGRKSIVFVHTRELLYQWADEIRDMLGVEPGMIGDDLWHEGDGCVTVAIMQSLVSKGVTGAEGDDPLNPAEYGMAVYDECHRTSVADTMHKVGQLFPSARRVGLSATPWRRNEPEEIWIEGAIGPVIYSREAEYFVREGYLACPRFESIEHDGPERGNEEYHEAYRTCIEESDARNGAIAKRAVELAHVGRQTIVNVNRIDQASYIVEAIEERDPDVDAAAVTSDTPDRDEQLDAFGDGEIDVVVSTLLKEGVDLPDVNAIILAHGGKSATEVVQTIGRALRPSNGEDALIVDVRDSGRSFGEAYHERQETMNEYYGAFGPDGEATTEDAGEYHEAEAVTDGGEDESESDDDGPDASDEHDAAELLRKASEGVPLDANERAAAAELADQLDAGG
jgi:superfamily II DNA or RNA helicase